MHNDQSKILVRELEPPAVSMKKKGFRWWILCLILSGLVLLFQGACKTSKRGAVPCPCERRR